jgi:hypothetical protein
MRETRPSRFDEGEARLGILQRVFPFFSPPRDGTARAPMESPMAARWGWALRGSQWGNRRMRPGFPPDQTPSSPTPRALSPTFIPPENRGGRIGTSTPNDGVRYVFAKPLRSQSTKRMAFTVDFHTASNDAHTGSCGFHLGRWGVQSLAVEISVSASEIASRTLSPTPQPCRPAIGRR